MTLASLGSSNGDHAGCGRLREAELGEMRGYAQRRADRRGYETPAGTLPSVTTILGATSEGKKALQAWLKRPGAEAIGEAARNRGTWTHAQIEAWIRGEEPQRRHFAFGAYIRNVLPWLEEHFDHAIAIERALWSPRGFSGTFDCLGYAKDDPSKLALFDWKTAAKPRSGALLEDYFCQLGAYTAGLEYAFGVRPERALLVIARPHGDGPDVTELGAAELHEYERRFMTRLDAYYGRGIERCALDM